MNQLNQLVESAEPANSGSPGPDEFPSYRGWKAAT